MLFWQVATESEAKRVKRKIIESRKYTEDQVYFEVHNSKYNHGINNYFLVTIMHIPASKAWIWVRRSHQSPE